MIVLKWLEIHNVTFESLFLDLAYGNVFYIMN